ncbi:maleylpyruvate isomerase family mycothiol-dependent enzyme [Gordonia sinesedis]
MHRTISRFDFIDAARTTGERFAALTRDLGAADIRLRDDPTWSVADCVGHIACEPSRYLDLISGDTEWPASAIDLVDIYAKQVANLTTRDVGELCDKLLVDLDALLDTVYHFAAQVPMMSIAGDRCVRADAALGILTGEMMLTGMDIARSLHVRWPVDRTIAPLVIRGRHQLLPNWVDQVTPDGHTATYDVRLRGCDDRFVYEFTDGKLELDPAEPRRADVHLSIDAAAALLTGNGRMSPTWAIASGRAMVWGPRPWLAPGLAAIFARATPRTNSGPGSAG